mmetsp:Transcript_69794/g.204666  ORF Transcript_69794/g.204666 Transcript_69794/m.204666 type:complete len:299 (+) Transcript_69794:132-1028(+)
MLEQHAWRRTVEPRRAVSCTAYQPVGAASRHQPCGPSQGPGGLDRSERLVRGADVKALGLLHARGALLVPLTVVLGALGEPGVQARHALRPRVEAGGHELSQEIAGAVAAAVSLAIGAGQDHPLVMPEFLVGCDAVVVVLECEGATAIVEAVHRGQGGGRERPGSLEVGAVVAFALSGVPGLHGAGEIPRHGQLQGLHGLELEAVRHRAHSEARGLWHLDPAEASILDVLELPQGRKGEAAEDLGQLVELGRGQRPQAGSCRSDDHEGVLGSNRRNHLHISPPSLLPVSGCEGDQGPD